MSYAKWKNFKILSHYDSANLIKQGRMPVPRMALFCPSSACDLKCYYCDYPEDNAKATIMAEYKALDVIKQLAYSGVKGIDFCGGGEPLLVPYAKKLLNLIKTKGMEFGIISNGTHFKDDLMQFIVKHGRYIRISLDSAIPELYTEMKGVDKCELVKENIVKAIEFKNKNNYNCEISVRIGLTKKNFTAMNLTKTLQFCYESGVDTINIRPLQQVADEIDEVNDKELITSLMEFIGQREYAEIMKGKERKLIVSFSKSTIETKCWLTPLHTVIMADGNVYLCCYFQDRKDKHCIGNILQKPFKEIWGSRKHKEAIANIDPKECNNFSCKFHQYNKTMNEFMQSDPEHL
jgi:MoaA/NifB/PqqE/SkfB family radical SAM enzyme